MLEFSGMEVVALLKNDRHCQNALFVEVTSYVRVTCYKKGYFQYFSDQDFDDIVNFAYMKILKGLHTYNTDKPFGKWVHSVILNVLKDYVNKHMIHLQHMESYDTTSCVLCDEKETAFCDGDDIESRNFKESLGPKSPEADAEISLHDLKSRIELILKTRDFRIFNMYVSGYEYEEIAQENGVSVGNARTIVRRAKEVLQKKLLVA